MSNSDNVHSVSLQMECFGYVGTGGYNTLDTYVFGHNFVVFLVTILKFLAYFLIVLIFRLFIERLWFFYDFSKIILLRFFWTIHFEIFFTFFRFSKITVVSTCGSTSRYKSADSIQRIKQITFDFTGFEISGLKVSWVSKILSSSKAIRKNYLSVSTLRNLSVGYYIVIFSFYNIALLLRRPSNPMQVLGSLR